MSKKDLKRELRALEREGCTVERTRSSHWRVVSPDGAVVVVGSSPGRCAVHRLRDNLRSATRRL